MTLQRPNVTCKPEELVLHALYRTEGSSNPGTKARCKEVTELATSGLTQALEALEGGAECMGRSGFATREDVHLPATSPDADELVKGA
jgi:hypothetical protein